MMKTTICVIIAITLATIHLSDAQQETNGCNNNCTTNGDDKWTSQICATNDEGKTKVFPNECIMRQENCVNKSKYVKTGPAEGASCP